MSGPAAAQVNVVITADNAYGFGFGSASGIPPGNYFGGINNLSPGAIFSCPIGNGPEAYVVPSPKAGDFLYIVAWSDQAATQGVIGQFKSGTNPTIYTGQGPWQVYATGVTIPTPLVSTSGPTLADINAQIALANAGGQPSATTSGTWVGTTPIPGGPGYLAFGEDNSSAGGNFPIVCQTAIDPSARWMWFNRDPSQPPDFAFRNGDHKEFLIFRLPVDAVPGSVCAPPPSGMVAWWPLDETGGLTVADISGNPNHNGQVIGPAINTPGGIIGGAIVGHRAFYFIPSSTSGWVSVPPNADFDFGTSGNFSIDAWGFNLFSNRNVPIVDKRDSSGQPKGYMLAVDGDGLRLRFLLGGTGYLSTNTLTQNAWNHVAVTVDRSTPLGTVTLYINGNPEPTTNLQPGQNATSTLPLLIGGTYLSPNPKPVEYALDEIEIFNRALSQTEIQGIFNAGSAGKCKPCVSPPSGMVAWYPLNELAGATAINDVAPPPSSIVNNVGTPHPGPVSPPGPSPAGPTPVVGQVGGALYFYGPYVEVAPSPELDFSTGDFTVDTGVNAFSIDAWVRIVQVGPTVIQPIVDKFSSPGGPGFAFYIRNQRLELNMNGSTFVSGPLIAFADPLANTGPWTHVAVTVQRSGRPPGQGVFYIDGGQAGTFTPSADSVNNGLPLWIGETRVPGPRGEIALDELELFNRALAQSELQAIFNAGSAGKCRCVPPPSGMVGWWPGDNHPNDILNGNNGTLADTAGGTLPGARYDSSGMVGQAFKFTVPGLPPTQTSQGQYVNVLTHPSLDLTQVTVDAWIKTSFFPPPLGPPLVPAPFAAPMFIVDKTGPNDLDGYSLFYRGQHPTLPAFDGTVVFLVRGLAIGVAQGTTNVADGKWHHIAGTYNGQEIKVYVDGKLEGTTAYTGGITYNHPAPGPLSIGRREWPGFPNGYYEGLIDEVEIFNRALSADEIRAIYNAGSAGKCKGIPVPVGPNFFGFPVCPPAPTAPVLSNTPASAQPLFVSTTATTALGGLAFNAFIGPVDIYEALVTPLPPPLDLLLYDGTAPPPPGHYIIGPWSVPPSLRANSAAPVNMTTPANGLFSVPLPLNPPGGIPLTFYEIVVPAGTNLATFDFATSPHYTWCNTKTLP